MITGKALTIYILLILLAGILIGIFILGIILSIDNIAFAGIAASFILIITRWTIGEKVMKCVIGYKEKSN